VKPNAPTRPKKARKKRAPEPNPARRLDPPTPIVRHRIEQCPVCAGRLSGVQVARRRPVRDLPPPVTVTEHHVCKGWCASCRKWREAPLDLRGQVVGQGRLGVGIAALITHLRLVVRAPLRIIQTLLSRRYGIPLSVGAITDLLRRLAQPRESRFGIGSGRGRWLLGMRRRGGRMGRAALSG
jgi:hypothetical protein